MRTHLLLAVLLSSCGQVGPLDDSAVGDVFLYTINAYPGADSLTLKLGGQRVAGGVAFGERHGDRTVCAEEARDCLPRLVRRTDGEFRTRFAGAGGADWDASADLAGMYPQETGTAIVTGPGRGVLVRHAQSISSSCSVTVVNALAVEEIADGAASYAIGVEFSVGLADAGFAENEGTTPFTGPCGALPTDAPAHAELRADRDELLGAIAESPWFFGVACEDEPSRTCFAWPMQDGDGRGRLGSGGAIDTALETAEYVDCVEAALNAPTCGDVPSWDDVQIDPVALQACLKPRSREAALVAPQSAGTWTADALCESRLRVRTPGKDLVFGPQARDDLGAHGNGALVTADLDIPTGSERFWTLYGRPVNPQIWSWDSSETFVDLSFYPYPE